MHTDKQWWISLYRYKSEYFCNDAVNNNALVDRIKRYNACNREKDSPNVSPCASNNSSNILEASESKWSTGASRTPRAYNWKPRAHLPTMNCVAFVRSKQSTQLTRRIPITYSSNVHYFIQASLRRHSGDAQNVEQKPCLNVIMNFFVTISIRHSDFYFGIINARKGILDWTLKHGLLYIQHDSSINKLSRLI